MVNYSCPNCGTVSPAGYRRCPMCGYIFPEMVGELPRRKSRVGWWLLFILAELSSFFITLLLCWLFSKAIDTDVFARETYLIFVVWAFVVYKIYQKFKPRLV